MLALRGRLVVLAGLLFLTGAVLYGLHWSPQGFPSPITVLDPADGLYRTARGATPAADTSWLRLDSLKEPVVIIRDQRHVPHIYAQSDRDAVIALGYAAARDRLFQMDFLPRVASGRLAEAVGPDAVETDRFLRHTGMEWGAQKNLERIRRADGIELDALQWYGQGVNAYLDRTDPADLPLEFRLLDYTPDRYTPIQGLRLIQYMAFDLTYRTDNPAYTALRDSLGAVAYERLYPAHPPGLFSPIVPSNQQLASTRATEATQSAPFTAEAQTVLQDRRAGLEALAQMIGRRGAPGTGSNNWAVQGERSATGTPLMAGDMHLSLSLPPIWYEAHLVTPSMNAYGLTIPGAPVLVQAFNQHVGWTITNTGADVIDHFALRLDSSGTRYRHEQKWRDLRRVVDTIQVNGAEPVLDTTYFSHHGPVRRGEDDDRTAVAERWVAHDSSRTLRALWQMNRADDIDDIEEALRDWDTPMQNILYAGRDSTIAIRSTGYLPVRRSGHGRGLLPGSTDAHEWIGRVPFDSLPAAQNPEQDILASANQKPTGPDYPYYLGQDWPDGYRSLRIDSLLRGASAHGVEDFKRYQADVEVQQHRVLAPFLVGLDSLSARADTLRRMLQRWEGEAVVDRAEPLVMDAVLSNLRDHVWDEPLFSVGPDPSDAVLFKLLRTQRNARWFDVQRTPQREDAEAFLRYVLEATADTLAATYGWRPSTWRWGDHNTVLFRHLLRNEALRPLGRGPYAYPGFEATLSPARGRPVTHSASQRVIIDFSTATPTGYGTYPGGQSGRPLDPLFYDTQIPTYLNFDYVPLRTPPSPEAFAREHVRARQTLVPNQ